MNDETKNELSALTMFVARSIAQHNKKYNTTLNELIAFFTSDLHNETRGAVDELNNYTDEQYFADREALIAICDANSTQS